MRGALTALALWFCALIPALAQDTGRLPLVGVMRTGAAANNEPFATLFREELATLGGFGSRVLFYASFRELLTATPTPRPAVATALLRCGSWLMGGAATGPVRPKLVINGIVRPAATCGLSSEDRADAIDLAIPLMATEPPSQHIGTMQKTHPHAEATYRVIAFDDGSFGVKVEIPETYPTTVSKFATEANAAAWITEDQRRVQSQTRRATDFRPAKPLS